MQDANRSSNTAKNETANRKRYWKLFAVPALWAFCGAWYLLPIPAESIERFYSRGLYRSIVGVVATASSAVPFSIILSLLCVAPIMFVLLWADNWIYRRRVLNLPHWRGAIWGFKWLLVVVPILWLWFLTFWGMGYQRLPMETRLDFDLAAISEEEVRHIEEGLLEIIHRDQPTQESDRDVGRAIKSVAHAMAAIVEEWEGRSILIPRRVKATPPGLLLMNGTSGICVPFTLEPHVDGGLPDTAFVAVAAHELGHIAGVCDEGETNLLGYAAGLRADDPYARYAVALTIYKSMARQSGEERDKAMRQLPEQARGDLKRASEASQRYRIDWFQKWSWRAYNQYLKSQGVREGVQSYGRGTQLLVYAWRGGYIDLPERARAADANETEVGDAG